MDSLALAPCRSCALLAALAAALAACGDDDAEGTPDSGGGSIIDAEPMVTDAAEPPDSGPAPDAAVLPGVTSITVSNNVACATLSNGRVRCWGANEQGQAGTGTVTRDPVTMPTEVDGVADAISVDCGTATCCALSLGGGVQCWGWNDQGALGVGLDVRALFNRPTAAPVLQQDKGQVALTGAGRLSVGGLHSCVLVAGQLNCWGWNQAGQGGLTAGNDGGPPGLLVATPSEIGNLTEVSSARCFFAEHTCAVTTDGQALCWGLDFNGELGDGDVGTWRGTAAPVVGLTGVTAIASGQKHSCAIANAGKGSKGVYCWGLNNFGQVGVDPPAKGEPNQVTPIEVPGLSNAVALTAGQSHSCALLDNGEARCWGASNGGQLGDGNVADGPHAEPAVVLDPNGSDGPLIGITQLSAGFSNTCAVTSDGRAYCWGANGSAQLGQGIASDPISRPILVPVAGRR
jgi:alpha-tubulin suppressor-like RCC1 family protein